MTKKVSALIWGKLQYHSG